MQGEKEYTHTHSRGSSQRRDWNWMQVSHSRGRFFTIWATREAHIHTYTRVCTYIYTFFCFWPHHMAYGILVPQPGIEAGPLAVKAESQPLGCQGSPHSDIFNLSIWVQISFLYRTISKHLPWKGGGSTDWMEGVSDLSCVWFCFLLQPRRELGPKVYGEVGGLLHRVTNKEGGYSDFTQDDKEVPWHFNMSLKNGKQCGFFPPTYKV